MFGLIKHACLVMFAYSKGAMCCCQSVMPSHWTGGSGNLLSLVSLDEGAQHTSHCTSQGIRESYLNWGGQ